MFSLNKFVKNGLIKAVGNMADYQIILNAAGWLEKGVLTEDDLAEIQTAIDSQYIQLEEQTETITEEKIEEPIVEETIAEEQIEETVVEETIAE